MMAELVELRDFAEQYTAAWCAGDPARVAGFYSDNGSLAVNQEPPAVGRSAIAAVAESFMTAFPDLFLVMDDLVPRQDQVEYHWTLTGTNTGPAGTGKRVRISGVETWRFAGDGLISSSQGRFDAVEYHRQLEQGV